MASRKGERHVRPKRCFPHIPPSDASRILERCEKILESSRELLANLRSVGIAELFARLDDSILQLAIQPDSWGERARARLMSDLAPALCAPLSPGSAVNIEDVVRVTNAVTPCLLLELGRRKGYIQIEFPWSPAVPNASFRLSVSPSGPVRTIRAEAVTKIVDQVGEAIVSLCYFGDDESREIVEAQLIETAHA